MGRLGIKKLLILGAAFNFCIIGFLIGSLVLRFEDVDQDTVHKESYFDELIRAFIGDANDQNIRVRNVNDSVSDIMFVEKAATDENANKVELVYTYPVEDDLRGQFIKTLVIKTGLSENVLNSYQTKDLVKTLYEVDSGKFIGIPSVIKPEVVVRDKFLIINFLLHLGFNNVRYQLEIGLYLAYLLGRRLVIPHEIRMRKCVNTTACEMQTLCRLVPDDGHYWCPIGLFLDTVRWKNAGAVISNKAHLIKNLSYRLKEGAFDDMWSEEKLWFDRIPNHLKSYLKGLHIYPKNLELSYRRFYLGCELAYTSHYDVKWESDFKKRAIYGFCDEFDVYREDVLELGGSLTQRIGLTPIFWPNADNLNNFVRFYQHHIVHTDEVVRLASESVTFLKEKSPTNSFVCIHLRRGDFIDAGWVNDGGVIDEAAIKKNINSIAEQKELVYFTTDELDPKTRKTLHTNLDGLLWEDVVPSLTPSTISLVYFQDYVGLVEQNICASARRFLGSKCSSFTGGIYNLRVLNLGDSRRDLLVVPNLKLVK